MLEELTAEEYDGWLDWMRKVQPFPNRDDWHWASLIAITHNQWAQHPISIWDASPYLDQFEEDITAEELLARIGISP